MADNTKRAKEQVDGHRKAIRDHIAKWRAFTSQQDKDFALKTIRNAQGHISKLRSDHPSIDSSSEDSWRP